MKEKKRRWWVKPWIIRRNILGAANALLVEWTSEDWSSSPVTGLEWPRGFQEVKAPRFHDNGTG